MKKILLIALCLTALSACSTDEGQDESLANDKTSETTTSTSQSNVYNFDSLVVKNNGLVQEDLELISQTERCQIFKDNAYKVDFELTNNFDRQINFSGKSSNIWDTTSMMTTKMSEFTYSKLIEIENIESSGVMVTQTKADTCFSQQNERINLQPGETVNYPLYFSVPPNMRNEDETVTIILGPNMYDYSNPTNTEDFSSDNIELIEFEI